MELNLEDLDSKYSKARQARLPFERDWYLNLAYFLGRQNAYWSNPGSGTFGKLVDPKAAPGEVKLVVNRIRSYVRHEISRLNSQKTRGFIIPASDDDDDRAAARAGENLLEFLYDAVRYNHVRELADFWMVITGNSFLKVTYDENKPNPNKRNPPGLPLIEALSPFHVLVSDLEEPQLDEQEWVMHTALRSREYIKTAYDVDVKEEYETTGDDNYVRLQNALQINSATSTAKGILVKEVWFKSGQVAIWYSGGFLAQFDENPYEHGHRPFVHMGHTPAGRFYNTTFVEDIRALQKEYNKSRSQLIRSRDAQGSPTWLVAAGSTDPRRLRGGRPGMVIPYMPGTPPPQQVPPPQLPAYIQDIPGSIVREMDDLASQHEVSKGSVPPNVEAAAAIGYLQERDDGPLYTALTSKERADQEVGRQLLGLAIQYWDQQRIVPIVGKNNTFEAFVLSNADVSTATDYRVVPGSAQPMSQAAKRAQIMELMKMGVVPPDKGLAFLDMPDIGKLYEEMQTDSRQAERENLKMGTGVHAQVNLWDNHIVHLQTHDTYKKREEFENSDEMTKRLMRKHDYQHLALLAITFGLQPQVPPSPPTFESQSDPLYVDPALETEYRRLYGLLVASGGKMPNETSPA